MNPFDELKGANENLAVQYESASEEPMGKGKNKRVIGLEIDVDNLDEKMGSRANSVRSPLAINKKQSSGG